LLRKWGTNLRKFKNVKLVTSGFILGALFFGGISYAASTVKTDSPELKEQKQICVHDAIADSPTKGTTYCTENFIRHEDGSISVSVPRE
jgi:hypothetical protein